MQRQLRGLLPRAALDRPYRGDGREPKSRRELLGVDPTPPPPPPPPNPPPQPRTPPPPSPPTPPTPRPPPPPHPSRFCVRPRISRRRNSRPFPLHICTRVGV